MSDLSLLLFGGGVSFIAVAGAYVYMRECFAGAKKASEVPGQSDEDAMKGSRDVA